MIYGTHDVGDNHAKTIYIDAQNSDCVAIHVRKDNANDKKNYAKASANNVSDSAEYLFTFCEIGQIFVIFFLGHIFS